MSRLLGSRIDYVLVAVSVPVAGSESESVGVRTLESSVEVGLESSVEVGTEPSAEVGTLESVDVVCLGNSMVMTSSPGRVGLTLDEEGEMLVSIARTQLRYRKITLTSIYFINFIVMSKSSNRGRCSSSQGLAHRLHKHHLVSTLPCSLGPLPCAPNDLCEIARRSRKPEELGWRLAGHG
jgi:hypothetical protein